MLIVGAGPVGISVALWCRFFGARHIVVSDLIGARAERAVDFGATGVIDASREDVAARVRQLSGGPPQVVFDCVGVPGSFQLAIDYAPHDARVVIVGLCMAADTFFPAKALTKELDLSFAFIYRKRDFEIVIDLLGRERIDPRGMVTEPRRLRPISAPRSKRSNGRAIRSRSCSSRTERARSGIRALACTSRAGHGAPASIHLLNLFKSGRPAAAFPTAILAVVESGAKAAIIGEARSWLESSPDLTAAATSCA